MMPESERIERDALADLHAAASPEVANALGLYAVAIETGLQSIGSTLPASAIVVNRTLGLGLDSSASASTVERIVAAYRNAGVDRFFIQIHPDAKPSEIPEWLAAQGLQKTRGWQKFQRGTQPPVHVPTELDIRRIGAQHGDAFASIVCDAFDLGDGARSWLRRLPGRDRWHVFMSFAGEHPAGTGTLYVDGAAGWLDFGATAPRFRQRGSQSALMARRIALALELGCRRLFTCTGEDVPGDPQHSYRNILKAGFTPCYLRANYAPPR